MKKLKMLLGILLSICLLAACGQPSTGGNQGDTGKSQGQSSENNGGSQDSEVSLSILVNFDPQTGGQLKLDVFDEVAEEMGYKISVERVDDETYKTKIRVMLQANEMPDLFYTWGGSYSEPFLAAEALYPLEKTIQESGYTLYDTYAQTDENGHIYAIPTNSLESYCMFYNKDVFSDLGLEVPETWEELLHVVEVCNENGIGAIGLGNKDRWEGDLLYNMLVVREDADAFANAMKGEGDFTGEAFLEAARKVETLVKMNAFQSGYMQASQSECTELLIAGKIAMYPTGSWQVAVFEQEENIGYTVFTGTGEENPYLSCCGNASDAGIAVSANSANAEAAARFAVEYSKRLNDRLVQEGELEYFETDVKPESQSEMMAAYVENFKKMEKTQLWWFTYLDTAIGEPMRDLSHEQFGGAISAEDFVQQLNKIIKE